MALVFVEGCSQTNIYYPPPSLTTTIVTHISRLFIEDIIIFRVAFTNLLLCIITCMHLCIIHTHDSSTWYKPQSGEYNTPYLSWDVK